MLAYIAKCGCPKHGVAQRMHSNVRVRVSLQAIFVVNGYAAQHQGSVRHQPVRIVAEPYSHALPSLTQGTQQTFAENQILRCRNLDVVFQSRDHFHRMSHRFEQTGVIRRIYASLPSLSIRRHQEMSLKCLRRLRTPQIFPRNRCFNFPPFGDALQRISKRHGCHGGTVLCGTT